MIIMITTFVLLHMNYFDVRGTVLFTAHFQK